MSEVARLSVPPSISVLRDQIAPEASDSELAFFAQVCARLELSPFAEQIVLIGRWDKRLGRKVHRHQITVAGRRTLAARTGELEGIDGPVWCGPRQRGELVWREVWDEQEPPYCARALVWRKGWKVPSNGTAKWDEFVQTDQGGVPLPLWTRMPSHMLGKTAESMALRRAFPDVVEPALEEGFPDDLEVDVPVEVVEAAAGVPRRLVTASVPADWIATTADQAKAHKTIAGLGPAERELFLANWTIDDFGEMWPVGAVADALGFELESSSEPAP